MDIHFKMELSLPSSSSADDDVTTSFNCLKPEGSVDQSVADNNNNNNNNNNNQQLEAELPHHSVDLSVEDDISFGNHDDQLLKPDDESVIQSAAEDDVISGGDSVDQSADCDVSSGDDDNQLIKPEDSVNQPADDDVSLGDDDNLKPDDSADQSAEDDVRFGDDSVYQSAADDVSFGFNHLQINVEDEKEEEEDDDDDVDGDFTFACVGDTASPNGYETGQIRTVFPLFDRSLLSGGDYNDGKLKLPINVPVDNVFVESPSNNGEYAGTVHALAGTGSGSPEMKMKSNSTGFSKLWRFKKEMNRSNSDSRDAFVFLESSNQTVGKSIDKVNASGRLNEKVNVKGKAVRKTLNSKKVTVSAHEVYLKQKGGLPEEERRRSYLPYRPGLMGFFTNVNGGLSKNVHPF